MVNCWVKFQREWGEFAYLFRSDIIKRLLPKEAKKFELVDISWRHEVTLVRSQSVIIDIMNQSKIVDIIMLGNDKMSEIRKSIKDFINPTKIANPILYKYEDFTILKILSAQRGSMKAAIQIVFPFIQNVKEDESKIASVTTQHEHTITFEKPISFINEKNEAKGVELILKDIDDSMLIFNKQAIIKGAIKAQHYSDVMSEPIYISLYIYHCLWCKNVAAAMNQGVVWSTFEAEQEKQNATIYKSKNSSLLILAMYHRDSIDFLKKSMINTDKSFEWQAIFKYELIGDKTPDLYLCSFLHQKQVGYHILDLELKMLLMPSVLLDYRTLLYNFSNRFLTFFKDPNYYHSIYDTEQIATDFSLLCGVPVSTLKCNESTSFESIKSMILYSLYCGHCLVLANIDTLSTNMHSKLWTIMHCLQTELGKGKKLIEIDSTSIKMRTTFNLICTSLSDTVCMSTFIKNEFRTLCLQEYNYKLQLEFELKVLSIENPNTLASLIVNCCEYVDNIACKQNAHVNRLSQFLKMVKIQKPTTHQQIMQILYLQLCCSISDKQNVADIIERMVTEEYKYKSDEISIAYEKALKLYNLNETENELLNIRSVLYNTTKNTPIIIYGKKQSGKTALIKLAYAVMLLLKDSIELPTEITYTNMSIWEKQIQRLFNQIYITVPNCPRLYTYYPHELLTANAECQDWVHLDGNFKLPISIKGSILYEPISMNHFSPDMLSCQLIYTHRNQPIKERIKKYISELPLYIRPTAECEKVLEDSLNFFYERILKSIFSKDTDDIEETLRLFFSLFEVNLLNKKSRTTCYEEYLKSKNSEELKKQIPSSSSQVQQSTNSFKYYSRYTNCIIYSIVWIMVTSKCDEQIIIKFQREIFDLQTELKELIGNAIIDVESRYLPLPTETLQNQQYIIETNTWQPIPNNYKIYKNPTGNVNNIYVFDRADTRINDTIEKMCHQGISYSIQGNSSFIFTSQVAAQLGISEFVINLNPNTSLSALSPKFSKWVSNKTGRIIILIEDVHEQLKPNHIEILEYVRMLQTKGISTVVDGQEIHVNGDSIMVGCEHNHVMLSKLQTLLVPIKCSIKNIDYYNTAYKELIKSNITKTNQALQDDIMQIYNMFSFCIHTLNAQGHLLAQLDRFRFILAGIFSSEIEQIYESDREQIIQVALYYCSRELNVCYPYNENIEETMESYAASHFKTTISWETFELSNYICKGTKVIPIDATLKKEVEKSIEAYCSGYKKKIDYILVKQAIQHIYSIINTYGLYNMGCALFGPLHYGKSAIAQLAFYMGGYSIHCYDVCNRGTVDSWMEFLREVLKNTISEGKKAAIFMQQFSLQSPFILDDIASLIFEGTILSAFNDEEISDIIEHGRNINNAFTPEKLWELSKSNIKWIYSFTNTDIIHNM